MKDTYKEYPLPEVIQDGNIFRIICEEGIFDGYSKRAALEKWKLKVDVLYRLQALEQGYIELSEEFFGCPTCGTVVFDVYQHISFHQDLTSG